MPTTDRLAVIHQTPPLPMTIAAAIAGRAAWLRRQLPVLDAELGVLYPPIEILPVAWYEQTRDGAGIVPGRVTVSASSGTNKFTVQLSAPALLEYGDDLILGILAHEFLHVVYETLTVWDHVRRFGEGTAVTRERSGYLDSWEGYRRIDAAIQASPDVWLTERLRAFAQQVEAESNPHITAAMAALRANWIDPGLPFESGWMEYDCPSIELDVAILHRAIGLGVIREDQSSSEEQSLKSHGGTGGDEAPGRRPLRSE